MIEPVRVPRLGAAHLPAGLLSIAVFGPGKGEAVVVRLPSSGGGPPIVGVVDGCREPEDEKGRGDPVRELVDELAPPRLAFVCLTHPHDDHYAGMGELLAAWEGRVDAVWKPPNGPRYAKDLLSYLKATRASDVPLPDDQDVAGLERVIHRMTRARDQTVLFKHTYADRVMRRGEVTITACGPDDGDADRAEQDLLATIRDFLEGKRRGLDPNVTSSALLIRWGKAGVLLAGDLLAAEGTVRGWRSAHELIDSRVQVVNVAHHASEGAHDPELWERMAPELAIVTPFKRGASLGRSKYPPRPEMIERLARTSAVAITTPPAWTEAERARVWHTGAPGPAVVAGRTAAGVHIPVDGPIRNAVAASLDSEGRIVQLVLAGEADLYAPRATDGG